MRSQIPQAHAFRQVMFHQVPCGLREQHLPSMPGTHDACGAMYVQAHITYSGKLRLAPSGQT